jgi:hypothetical protein
LPPVRRCVLLAALALALTAGPAEAAGPGRIGVMVDGPMIDGSAPRGEWDRLAASGAASVRAPVYWSQAQPLGPERTDVSAPDAVVLAAARRGLDVLPVVLGTPGWAGGGGRVTFATPPADTRAYGAFLETLARRYGPRGRFWREHPGLRPRPIRAWQVWNEPNLEGYWSEQPFARGYVGLLQAARRGLRRADPKARVVAAGLPGESWLDLDRMYRAGGGGLFDAVAIHPYTARPRDVVRILEYVRRTMARHGDRATPLWVTELSWPASTGRTHDHVGNATDDRGQAVRLRAGLRRLAAAARRLKVRRTFWYTWLSDEREPSTFAWSGLRRLRPDGRVVSTPALRAFRRLAR